MGNEPWALPMACFSIILKASAIDRSYPGGRPAFIDSYKPQFRNGALFLLVRLSLDDVDQALDHLNAQGLIPGTDLAVADMTHGPLVPCTGLTFTCEGEFPAMQWTVCVSSDRHPPKGHYKGHSAYALNPLGYLWEAPVPEAAPQPVQETSDNQWRRVVKRGGLVTWIGGDDDDEAGLVDVKCELVEGLSTPEWSMIAARPFSGCFEWGEEYLMARKAQGGIALDIFGNQILGEVPDDWFDEDGEPVPTHRAENGEMRLPEMVAGSPIVGCQDGYFVGDLVPVQDFTQVIVTEVTEVAVRRALSELCWEYVPVSELLEKLNALN